ncbi:molybdenum cofactor biosynthesis protein MoeB [Xylanibacillus composti]|uniref:Molybdenum cofactor biosynthesis protein MoeB n=1 Tax=Xylanibacillus composti TaxID=1572762 RepID=A0A8J4M361_9BACL|nr:molybdopterin-synthase adenylyltransferase MoeB [Xylanibacillus composti]GIQ69652.1 molybdenum cofactor biosynthesis protein MoeB [Xylanibacillus composti]
MTAQIAEAAFNEKQLERYSRQLLLPEIGIAGQKRLACAKVLFIGAGGLGSPASLYLAAAGVGTIGLVDCDRVDRSNLHRQILHDDASIGMAKTRSARQRLIQMNPEVQVIEHEAMITSANAFELIALYDLVINGSDNFPTRYLVNDACVLLGKPLVDASILKWEGSVSVFMPGQGCYRCLYPQPPKPGTVPSCAEAGIVGAVAGIMGSYQALEAVKVLLGLDSVLANKTIMMDLLAGTIHTIKRSRRASCPVCGDQPEIDQLIDYEQFCGLPKREEVSTPAGKAVEEEEPASQTAYSVSVLTAREWLNDPDTWWIDVREEEEEYRSSHIPGSRHIPFSELQAHMDTLLQGEKRLVFICQIGKRSKFAVRKCLMEGCSNIYNLDDGLLAWENAGLPLTVIHH